MNKKIKLVHLFFLGNYTNEKISDDVLLTLAINTYNDIIIIDTPDNYRNILYKHLAVIDWTLKYCSNAAYIFKLDDDVFINIKSLTRSVMSKMGLNSMDSKFLYCHIQKHLTPIRENVSKWYIDNATYIPLIFIHNIAKGLRILQTWRHLSS